MQYFFTFDYLTTLYLNTARLLGKQQKKLFFYLYFLLY